MSGNFTASFVPVAVLPHDAGQGQHLYRLCWSDLVMSVPIVSGLRLSKRHSEQAKSKMFFVYAELGISENMPTLLLCRVMFCIMVH